jgi:hypothetical protein
MSTLSPDDFDEFENSDESAIQGTPQFDTETYAANGKELGKRVSQVQWDMAAWYTEWEARGKELAKRDGDVRWELGEWLAKGEPNYPGGSDAYFPSFYSCAEAITGLARSTLRDIASTYNRAVSVRTDKLTWSHHRVLVNALPKADDVTLKTWLNRAAEDGMTVVSLQAAAKASTSRIKNPIKVKSFRVTVPLGVVEMLKVFAAYERTTVQKVAAQWLIEISKSEDKQLESKFARGETKERLKKRRQEIGRRLQLSYPGKSFGN